MEKTVSGETTLSFAATTLANTNLKDGFMESNLNNKPIGIEICFTTVDFESTIKSAVEEGEVIVENPKTKPWEQVVAYLRDLDGFLIKFVQK